MKQQTRDHIRPSGVQQLHTAQVSSSFTALRRAAASWRSGEQLDSFPAETRSSETRQKVEQTSERSASCSLVPGRQVSFWSEQVKRTHHGGGFWRPPVAVPVGLVRFHVSEEPNVVQFVLFFFFKYSPVTARLSEQTQARHIVHRWRLVFGAAPPCSCPPPCRETHLICF